MGAMAIALILFAAALMISGALVWLKRGSGTRS